MDMQYIKKILVSLIVVSFFVIFSVSHVFAASIDMQSTKTMPRGANFSIDITAVTDGQSINSIDAIVDFPENLVSFVGYKNEGAVVNLWLNPPHEKDGQIYMSGIVPGGVTGLYDPNKKEIRPVPLTRLLFVAKHEGVAHFTFTKTELLKNDGQGTTLSHTDTGTDISIINDPNFKEDPNNASISDDAIPPLPFSIELTESSIFSKTPAMLVFKAEDADSGIKEYKIKIGSSHWKNAQNPQVVGNSIFSRSVTIRAYDFAGNFQDENIYIPGFIPFKSFSVICLLLLSGILVYKLLKYRL